MEWVEVSCPLCHLDRIRATVGCWGPENSAWWRCRKCGEFFVLDMIDGSYALRPMSRPKKFILRLKMHGWGLWRKMRKAVSR